MKKSKWQVWSKRMPVWSKHAAHRESVIAVCLRMLQGTDKRWYLFLVLLAAVYSLKGVGWAESFRRMINGAIEQDAQMLVSGLTLSFLVLIVSAVSGWCLAYATTYFQVHSVSRFQSDVVQELLDKRVDVFKTYHTADLVSRVMESSAIAQRGVNDTIIKLMKHLLQMLCMLLYLGYLDWRLTTATFLLCMVFYIAFHVVSAYIRSLYTMLQEKRAETVTFVQDTIAGMEEVRSFHLKETFQALFLSKYDAWMAYKKRTMRVEAFLDQSFSIVNVFGTIFIFAYGGKLVMEQEMDVGALVAFLVSFARLSSPVSNLLKLWPGLQRAAAASKRVFEVIDLPAEQSKPTAVEQVRHFEDIDELQVKDVHFGYTSEQPILQRCTFEGRSGQKIALVGPSGGGKSTVLKLLLGFYKPFQGRIRLNGCSIDEVPIERWRSQMTYLGQEVDLFPGTIYDNIRMANPHASRTAIEQAARDADLHDTIVSLPAQYDTAIGENGIGLSGGQKQRLALARALLRDSPIVLLDEPTSALDVQSSARIQSSLRQLFQGKIAIVVAHRLSTITDFDHILFIENGIIAERGTHDELMKRKQRYYALYERNNSNSMGGR